MLGVSLAGLDLMQIQQKQTKGTEAGSTVAKPQPFSWETADITVFTDRERGAISVARLPGHQTVRGQPE